MQMTDQGEQVPQVPAGENLRAAQPVAVVQPPPPPPLQNQEEPANPNSSQSAGEAAVKFVKRFVFAFSARVLAYGISIAVLNFRSRRLAFN